MIRSHLGSEIFDIFCFLSDSFTSPPRIDPPSDVCQTRTSDHIPPRIHIRNISVFHSKNIRPTILHSTIKPSSLEWMKSYFSVIGFRTCKIDLMMCTVEISSPENMMSLRSEFIHIFCKLCIENQFSLPCFFTLPTIWKINTKNIKNILSECHLYMSHAAFIRRWIFWETIHKANICNIRNSFMNPYTRSSIARFFSRIIVNGVIFRSYQIRGKLIWFCFDFLKK